MKIMKNDENHNHEDEHTMKLYDVYDEASDRFGDHFRETKTKYTICHFSFMYQVATENDLIITLNGVVQSHDDLKNAGQDCLKIITDSFKEFVTSGRFAELSGLEKPFTYFAANKLKELGYDVGPNKNSD